MDIEKLKKAKKEKKLTFDQLSSLSGIPVSTIYDIFRGVTSAPRIDTVQAIERALGLSETEISSPADTLTDKEKRLLKAYNTLIPPMQEYVLETTEKLASQPQNVAKRA